MKLKVILQNDVINNNPYEFMEYLNRDVGNGGYLYNDLDNIDNIEFFERYDCCAFNFSNCELGEYMGKYQIRCDIETFNTKSSKLFEKILEYNIPYNFIFEYNESSYFRIHISEDYDTLSRKVLLFERKLKIKRLLNK